MIYAKGIHIMLGIKYLRKINIQLYRLIICNILPTAFHPLEYFAVKIKQPEHISGCFLRCSFLSYYSYCLVYCGYLRVFASYSLNIPVLAFTSLCGRFCHNTKVKEVVFLVSVCKLFLTTGKHCQHFANHPSLQA